MPLKMNPLPAQGYLKECFEYNPDTGQVRWRVRPAEHFKNENTSIMWNSKRAGNIAGSATHPDKRVYVCLDKKSYQLSRIIWKLVTGRDPLAEIDHIDKNPRNNTLSNLREASRLQNQQNKNCYKTNKTGLKGVYHSARIRRYIALISLDGKQKYLGCFKTGIEAYYAYCKAAVEYHGEFASFR